jgi:hypothetical protein
MSKRLGYTPRRFGEDYRAFFVAVDRKAGDVFAEANRWDREMRVMANEGRRLPWNKWGLIEVDSDDHVADDPIIGPLPW